MSEQEFIVAYSPTWLMIEPESMKEYNHYALYYQYMEGLMRTRARDPQLKYGDVISYNNRFWCSVKATNAKEALNKALDKINAYRDTQKSAT